ncbi:hypothetical protein JOH51_001520 [Rhizobium leguminosarum]|nr:hypothetical protein [Rhizobium leguminosarum]
MPHKFNADRRDKIAKQKFQVTNWPAYNESLRQRGDLTIWVSDEALCRWSAPRRASPGGQAKYSDLAITLCLTLRVVYGLALRQTQGLMRSVAALMEFDIAVPDFSTLSHVAADDGAVENIQGSKKCGGAVALVIMGHRAGTTLLHGKTRLRPIQRLDLTFLIDGEDNRMGRRRDVETDHIVKLLGESLVVR